MLWQAIRAISSTMGSLLMSVTHGINKTTQMPSIWAITCGYVGVWGLWPPVHVHLGKLCCQMKSLYFSGPGCCCGSCLVVWSRSSQVVCWCLWLLGPPWDSWGLDGQRLPETMLKDLAAARGILIWVASSSIFFKFIHKCVQVLHLLISVL